MTSKSHIYSGLFALLLCAFAGAAESGYPFDSGLKKIELQMEADTKSCDVHKNPMKMLNCKSDVRAKQELTGTVRGTREYARATYLKLDSEELEKTRLRLMEEQDRARDLQDFSRVNKRPPGELIKEMLGVELGIIEDELRRRGRTRDQANIEKWKKLTGKEPGR